MLVEITIEPLHEIVDEIRSGRARSDKPFSVCSAGENWNQVMYDGMRTTNPAAALYFLFIVIIGNYVVLNLFLAILLDQFAGGNTSSTSPARRRDTQLYSDSKLLGSGEHMTAKQTYCQSVYVRCCSSACSPCCMLLPLCFVEGVGL